MHPDFETLITGFIENKIGIAENFLSTHLSGHLKDHLLELHRSKTFHAAEVGNRHKHIQNSGIRGDQIYWLDKKHNNPFENEVFTLIEDFIRYLNRSCYAGITDYEFHYTYYPTGAFYKKHLDQFHSDSDRKYSLITYLNSHWKDCDGGELVIHNDTKIKKINPTQGKTVFFKSNELIHEVLLTHQPRISITGWLKSKR